MNNRIYILKKGSTVDRGIKQKKLIRPKIICFNRKIYNFVIVYEKNKWSQSYIYKFLDE